jgi:threonine aldolase
MRQAGVIAAAGLVALKNGPRKMAGDHTTAKSLARGLASIPGVSLDPASVQTNIVFFDLDDTLSTAHFLAAAASGGAVPGYPSMTVPTAAELDVSVGTTTSATFSKLVEALSRCRIGSYSGYRLRAVTHHQVTDADVEALLKGAAAAAALLRAPAKGSATPTGDRSRRSSFAR